MSIDTLSPPFQAPEILNRRRSNDLTHSSNNEQQGQDSLFHNFITNLGNVFLTRKGSHCNKFYPFTKKQLKSHDHVTFVHMTEIWRIVASWKDPLANEPCWWTFLVCLKQKGAEAEKEQSLLNNDYTSVTSQNNPSLRVEETAVPITNTVDL